MESQVKPESTQLAPTAPGPKKKSIPFWRRSVALNLGAIITVIVLLMAFFPTWLTSYDPITHNTNELLLPPGGRHLLGTDNYGRDVWSRIVWATRVDLQIGLLGMLIPFTCGTLIGLVAGFYGGFADQILMRIVDIVVAFPFHILIIAIMAILGPGIFNFYLAMAMVGWVPFARITRGEVLVAKNLEYVQAARALGYTDSRTIVRHILPNVISSSVVYAAADVVFCMLAGASLGFLGLGVQPPIPEWGASMSEGRVFMATAYWLIVYPGLALVVAGVGFSLLGDGLADLLRTKGR